MQKLNSKKTYSEMYEILNILGENYINKLPKKMYDLIDSQRDLEYKPNLIMENGMLNESAISRETIALFAVLNVQYFVEDENLKQEYMKVLKDNEKKYQLELKEKYNPDKIFENNLYSRNANKIEEKCNQMIEYKKENIFRKFIKKVKNILHL